MNNFKIALLLLVLPFFVMADNPITPADKDASNTTASDSVAQVESRTESIERYETSTLYSESMGIEDVIVTATRRETSIMETPLAISAVTQEELTRFGITNIKDLSYALPGLAIQNSDTNAPIITLRGIRSKMLLRLVILL